MEVRGSSPGPPVDNAHHAPSDKASESWSSRRALSSPRTRKTPMAKSHRRFNCGRCRRQVRICTSCDRGNVYCAECSPEAARQRVLKAGARYQRTEAGRLNHSLRQQRYLDRVEEKMTHRGPPSEPDSVQPRVCPETDVLNQLPGCEEVTHECESDHPTAGRDADEAAPAAQATGLVPCDLCGRLCSAFARRWPIRRRRANPENRRQPQPPGYHRRDSRRQASRRQSRRR